MNSNIYKLKVAFKIALCISNKTGQLSLPLIRHYINRPLHNKMKFSMKDFFSKCDQICRKLKIWSHLLKKSLMGNFSFYAVDHAFKCVNLENCVTNNGLIDKYELACYIKVPFKKNGSAKTPNTNPHKRYISNCVESILAIFRFSTFSNQRN